MQQKVKAKCLWRLSTQLNHIFSRMFNKIRSDRPDASSSEFSFRKPRYLKMQGHLNLYLRKKQGALWWIEPWLIQVAKISLSSRFAEGKANLHKARYPLCWFHIWMNLTFTSADWSQSCIVYRSSSYQCILSILSPINGIQNGTDFSLPFVHILKFLEHTEELVLDALFPSQNGLCMKFWCYCQFVETILSSYILQKCSKTHLANFYTGTFVLLQPQQEKNSLSFNYKYLKK